MLIAGADGMLGNAMTLAAALRALADSEARAARAETRAQQLEWERTRLTLRVQDLEQQLTSRTRGPLPAPAAATLSFFQDLCGHRLAWLQPDQQR